MAVIDLVSLQERKSQETRRKILEATERLLAEYDFKYVTVRNICKEGDVAYGSFYHHFQSKENLLYIYGKELYERIRDQNPCPDDVEADDFVNRILWQFVVLGEFCSRMGKEFTHCIYQTASLDLFQGTFDTIVEPELRRADEEGLIQHYIGINVLPNIIKDVQIVYQGVIMWWCNQEEDREPLAATMEHLMLHTLTMHRARRGHEVLPPEVLVTDSDYRKLLNMEGVPERE